MDDSTSAAFEDVPEVGIETVVGVAEIGLGDGLEAGVEAAVDLVQLQDELVDMEHNADIVVDMDHIQGSSGNIVDSVVAAADTTAQE